MHPLFKAAQVSTLRAAKAFGQLATRAWDNRQVGLQTTALAYFATSTCLAFSSTVERALAGQSHDSFFSGMSVLAGGLVTLGWLRARDVTKALRHGPADAARWLYTRHLSAIESTDKPGLVAFGIAGPMVMLAHQHQGNNTAVALGLAGTFFGLALGLSAKSHQSWLAEQMAQGPGLPQRKTAAATPAQP